MENVGKSPTPAPRRITHVADVKSVCLTRASDERGSLLALEFRDLPFEPLRCFVVSDVPSSKTRGEHAHWECHQLLVCTSGSLSVSVTDGVGSKTFHLDGTENALYIPPLIWASQFLFSEDASLLVLASDAYDSRDYIRDFEEFANIRAKLNSTLWAR